MRHPVLHSKVLHRGIILGEDAILHLFEHILRIGIVVGVRSLIPKGVLIELQGVASHASRVHHAQTAIAQRQSFFPEVGGFVIPQMVLALDGRSLDGVGGSSGKGEFRHLIVHVARKVGHALGWQLKAVVTALVQSAVGEASHIACHDGSDISRGIGLQIGELAFG